jgi:hypothetical protein
MIDAINVQLPKWVISANEFYGNATNPPMRDGEKKLLVHEGGLQAIQRTWPQKSPKNLHKGQIKGGKLVPIERIGRLLGKTLQERIPKAI